MSKGKIVKGKATVHPHPTFMGKKQNKESKKMNGWEFLDKQFERLYDFMLSPCGIITLFMILSAICALYGVRL